MDLVADELLDGGFVSHFPAIPPSIGDFAEYEKWREGWTERFLEEDEIKIDEVSRLPNILNESELRIVSRHIPEIELPPVNGKGVEEKRSFEGHVKGLFQHADAAIFASGKHDLIEGIRVEDNALKIHRILLLGVLVTSVVSFFALGRWLILERGSLTVLAVLREVTLAMAAIFMVFLSIRMWTEQSKRLYKRVIHSYVAVALESDERMVPEFAEVGGYVALIGKIPEATDVSAIAALGSRIVVATDEGAALHIFEARCLEEPSCGYTLEKTIDLKLKSELDAEAIAIGRTPCKLPDPIH